tara:strand:+ start:463 stop:654 length:192 start_codon:yes stop_codon:yes gene_type:complete
MVCRVCGDKKMVAVPVKNIIRSRNQYDRDYEVTKTQIGGGVDACHFCTKESEQDYQQFLEETL